METERCREFLEGGPGVREIFYVAYGEDVGVRRAEAMASLGDLQVECQLFLHRVLCSACERVVKGSGAKLIEVLQSLHYSDLYLATAMGAGMPVAWEIIHARFGDFVRSAAASLTRDRSVASEVASDILAELFFTDRAEGRSRIVSYSGASSLERWLWLVLRHRVIDRVRRRKKEVSLDGVPGFADEPLPASVDGGQTTAPATDDQLLAGERRKMLSTAIPSAFAELAPEDRLLLKWLYIDGVSQRQAAALNGVHESRVSRWIERVRRELFRSATQKLTRTFGLDMAEAADLIRRVSEADVGIGLDRLLQGPQGPRRGAGRPADIGPSKKN